MAVKSVGVLDPYERVEAETISWSEGVKTDRDKKFGIYVTSIHNDDYIRLQAVDFKEGARTFEVSAATATFGGKIEIRLNDRQGTLLGVCKISNTGGWETWKTFGTGVKKIEGVHDLFLIFKGGEKDKLYNLDYWKFG